MVCQLVGAFSGHCENFAKGVASSSEHCEHYIMNTVAEVTGDTARLILYTEITRA